MRLRESWYRIILKHKKNNMSRAFFSHSSKQKELVESLVKRIGRDNAVFDKYNFEVGFPTLDEIFKGIEKTDLFILFLLL